MAPKYSDEFRRDAGRIATTSGLKHPQIASDFFLGGGDPEQVGSTAPK